MKDGKKLAQDMNTELDLAALEQVSGGSAASAELALMVKICYNGCGSQAEYDNVKKAMEKLSPGCSQDKDFIKVDNYFQGLLNTKGHIVNDDAEMIMRKHGKGFSLNM